MNAAETSQLTDKQIYASLQVTGPYSWGAQDMLAAGFRWSEKTGHWHKDIATPADEQKTNDLARRLSDQGRSVHWLFNPGYKSR